MSIPREPYKHNRLLPCPGVSCGATNARAEIILNDGGSVHVHLRCRCCGFRINQEGTDSFRVLSEAFGNWNNQTRLVIE
ncbi:MAG: hypothetical protein K0S46_2218 [Moraxellaceae bacterium]|jgi:hypothetical protein|nr:hypothetical protein [Moraxellaceae bacterium]